MRFTWPVRVYIEDTDAGGIVFYANYLRFMERARSEWLRSLGFGQENLRQANTLFVVAELHIRYRRPAKLDDELSVSVDVEQLRKASMTIRQRLSRGGETLVEADVRIACTDTDGRPKALAQNIFDAVMAVMVPANPL